LPTGILVFELRQSKNSLEDPENAKKQLLPTHKNMTQGVTHQKIVSLLCGTAMTSHFLQNLHIAPNRSAPEKGNP